MKKILTLVVSAAAFTSACKKSESKPPASLIVGKWKHTKDIVQSFNAAGQLNSTETADYSKSNDYYQFNSDGTGLIYEETAIGSGKYNSLAITYTVKGNSLTLFANGQSENDTIESITSSSLVIHAEIALKDQSGNITEFDKVDEYFTK